MGCLVLGFQRAGFLTWTLTASNFNALQSHSNAGKKVIDTQCTFVLFSGMFACTEPRSATRKSRSPLLAPLPFTPSSHSNLFFSEVCALFSLTAVSQPFVYQSLRHSFHRDRGAHPSSQELCALFASCSSPLPVPKSRRPLPLRVPNSRRINTCKSLSKQRTLTTFRMIDLQKTGGGGVWLTSLIGRLNSRQVSRTSRDTPQLSRWGRPRRFTHHKLRFDGDLLHVFAAPLDLIDDSLCRNLPHPYQRLSNRSEARVGVGGSGNVIESNHGDVLRHTQACFLDRPDRTDGGNIVVSKKRREWLLPRQQLFGERVSNPWRRIGSFQSNGQLGPNRNVHLLGHFTDRAPPYGGVRTDRLPLDEGDLFVP